MSGDITWDDAPKDTGITWDPPQSVLDPEIAIRTAMMDARPGHRNLPLPALTGGVHAGIPEGEYADMSGDRHDPSKGGSYKPITGPFNYQDQDTQEATPSDPGITWDATSAGITPAKPSKTPTAEDLVKMAGWRWDAVDDPVTAAGHAALADPLEAGRGALSAVAGLVPQIVTMASQYFDPSNLAQNAIESFQSGKGISQTIHDKAEAAGKPFSDGAANPGPQAHPELGDTSLPVTPGFQAGGALVGASYLPVTKLIVEPATEIFGKEVGDA